MDYPLDMTMRISPEAIYSYIYVLPRGTLKKELTSCLRQNHKRRYKQRRGVKIARNIEDMLSIEERPKEVEDRIIPGHWEGDLIVGKNNRSVLGTLVERTTRTTILIPLKNREAETVAKSFAREVKKLPQQMKLSNDLRSRTRNGSAQTVYEYHGSPSLFRSSKKPMGTRHQ